MRGRGLGETLLDVHDRLVEAGSSPGEVTRFGPALLSVFFRDPDGAELEVAYFDAVATAGGPDAR